MCVVYGVDARDAFAAAYEWVNIFVEVIRKEMTVDIPIVIAYMR